MAISIKDYQGNKLEKVSTSDPLYIKAKVNGSMTPGLFSNIYLQNGYFVGNEKNAGKQYYNNGRWNIGEVPKAKYKIPISGTLQVGEKTETFELSKIYLWGGVAIAAIISIFIFGKKKKRR